MSLGIFDIERAPRRFSERWRLLGDALGALLGALIAVAVLLALFG
jgi:hypothetical protein